MLGGQVGNYVITAKLGEGGMGEVYLAEHPTIGKRVALKILHADLASNPEIVTRFFNEAKTVNEIGHPNIVDIVDFGAVPTQNGRLVYLVMELLDGSTLTGVLQGGPLEEKRAVRVARTIADALSAAHERGVIHRDLKPDNVMLVTRGREQDVVKLLDFGIAKVTAGPLSSKTQTGMVLGTPAYMSPEQCEGRPSIDHRADIYSLGIVLYQMLTGRVPFEAQGLAQLMVMQLTDAPPAPSVLRPGLSPHLEAVVLKALQKQPDRRFSTMREFADALYDPVGYVESCGGLAGFMSGEAPRRRSQPMTGPQLPDGRTSSGRISEPRLPQGRSSHGRISTREVPTPTTLSHSAAQLAAVTPSTQYPTSSGRRWVVITSVMLAALIGGGVMYAVARKDRHVKPSAESTITSDADAGEVAVAVATPADAVIAENTPTPPPPAPDAAPVAAPDPVPVQTREVTLSFSTRPSHADVFVGGEKKPRCTTPCSFELERADRDTTITFKLAGSVPESRVLHLTTDHSVDVALEAKPSAKKPSDKKPKDKKPTPSGKPEPREIGDNTLNPFE